MPNNTKPIQTPEDLTEFIAECQAERERIRELSEEIAEEVYQIGLADFHGDQGHRRITELAKEHGILFNEALEKFGNALTPRPPGHTASGLRVGSVVDMTTEERQERAELKRILATRDLSGLSAEQRQTLSLEEQEFLTRPRDGVDAGGEA